MKLKPLEIRALLLMTKAGTGWRDPKQITSGLGLEVGDPLRKSYRVWNRLADINYLDFRRNSEIAQGAIRGPDTTPRHPSYIESYPLQGEGLDAPWHVSTKVVHGD